MIKFRSILACLALALGFAAMPLLTACGTGVGGADPAASTPATSHFKADLASGYGAIEAVRVAATSALQTKAITVAQAQAVQTQCQALTATLDSLRAMGESSTSQTALTATLAAIGAATVYITTSQGVPKS